MIDFNFGVSLGPVKIENLKTYLDARNDHRVWKWCRQNDVINESHHQEYFKKVMSPSSNVRLYEILDFSGKLVGVCGLTDICQINRRAEFSLYVIPEHQMRGFAKAALKTLLAHGFYNLGLHSIWGETFDGNPAYNLFLRLGMRHDGTRRQFYFRSGDFIDCHLVSITRDEFDHAKKTWESEEKIVCYC